MKAAMSPNSPLMKPKTKPGEWWFVASFLCLLCAPVLFFVTQETDQKIQAIVKDGIVSEAVVKLKYSREVAHTSSTGKARSTTSYMLSLSYDLMSKNRYADWSAGKAYVAPPYPAQTTAEIEVSKSDHESLKEGDKTLIAMIPYQSETVKLASDVQWLASGTQSRIQLALVVIMVLIGLWTGHRGWRARKNAA